VSRGLCCSASRAPGASPNNPASPIYPMTTNSTAAWPLHPDYKAPFARSPHPAHPWGADGRRGICRHVSGGGVTENWNQRDLPLTAPRVQARAQNLQVAIAQGRPDGPAHLAVCPPGPGTFPLPICSPASGPGDAVRGCVPHGANWTNTARLGELAAIPTRLARSTRCMAVRRPPNSRPPDTPELRAQSGREQRQHPTNGVHSRASKSTCAACCRAGSP
jgi:hypothetical protein